MFTLLEISLTNIQKHNFVRLNKVLEISHFKLGRGSNPILRMPILEKSGLEMGKMGKKFLFFFNDCVKFALILAIFNQMPIMFMAIS